MVQKIAVLASSKSWGGLELNLSRWIAWLWERKWKIIFLGNKDSTIFEKIAPFCEKSLHFQPKQKHLNLRKAYQLAQILKKEQITILWIGHPDQIYLATLCKKLFAPHLKLVYWQQMQITVKKRDIYHNSLFRQIDIWVAPLEISAQQVAQNTAIPRSKIHVLPLPANLTKFRTKQGHNHKEINPLALPLNSLNAFLAGIVGRIDKQKGQATLIEALAILQQDPKTKLLLAQNQFTDIQVIIVGEETVGSKDNYLKYLQTLTQKLDLQEKVHFRPFRTDIEQAFFCFDAFVMASWEETFGMVTIEAMAAGVPVIGTNSGGTPELLQYGKLGQLFSPKNPSELAECLRKLLSNLPQHQSIAQIAQEVAFQKFDFQEVMPQFEHLLTKAL
ncbi:MAG: glycosyltransferase family 4 protein [Microscillaceae bacterium]|nr:glycosyltransferase family 4 protein [Microscillaceae bacterium]MDW8461847.1 glycosyltransferase family 4 protein [Cytophagales bacterium]